ncbi:MAG: DUF2953 domain-containing protein [Ruminococcaceae bacterium]|nr:DUF2953 domain-containing protein [Oscillospiraceae bacterium]
MGWFIALGILVILAILPLGVSAIYEAGGPLIRLIAGPVRIQLYPGKNKEKAEKKKPAPAAPAKKPAAKAATAEKKPGKWTDFLPLVRTALDFLGEFRRKLRVKVLEVKVTMAGDDPCDLATNYGRAWAALGNLWPRLERLFVIKKRDVQIQCDFTATETVIYARLDLTITLGRLLSLAVRYGIRAIREYLQIIKSRKGGASI